MLPLINLLLLVQLAVVMMLMSCSTGGQRIQTSDADAAPYTPPSYEQKRWALGTCAILTDINRRRHDLLGGCLQTPEEVKIWRECLAQWWKVRSREDLLETLRWLDSGGHRNEFDEIAQELSATPATQLAAIRERSRNDLTLSNRVEIVLKYQKELGAKSIIAWDYGRYISLCGWGYIVGYLTEEEAWQKIMPVARFLQGTFDSWEDLGKNYVIGREFWSPPRTREEGKPARKSYAKLLTDPASPWARLPWKLDLSTSARESSETAKSHGASTNGVDSSGKPLPAFIPTAQWTWKPTSTHDAAIILNITLTGPTIPEAHVSLPLKRCDTKQGPAWVATNSILLADAPWDSVCKGGHRTVTFNSVSTNGVGIGVNRRWGPATLEVLDSVQVEVKGERNYCKMVDVPMSIGSCECCTFIVPYAESSRGTIGDISFTATWIHK